jgi:hypothetical protein
MGILKQQGENRPRPKKKIVFSTGTRMLMKTKTPKTTNIPSLTNNRYIEGARNITT